VIVTGAQLFDAWFDRKPSVEREEFLACRGLPRRGYALYVGSSPNITRPKREIRFVQAWIKALRESGIPALEQLGVLVRPHPYNVEEWSRVDLAAMGGAVAPMTKPELPMTPADEDLYYDSIHFASAVFGINTTAMVESFIQRRPVLTLAAPEFDETQGGTLHFRRLRAAGDGALRVASTMDEHLAQLREAIEHPETLDEAIDAFLLTFVRPRGLDQPATPLLVDAIEELAGRGASRAESRDSPQRATAA